MPASSIHVNSVSSEKKPFNTSHISQHKDIKDLIYDKLLLSHLDSHFMINNKRLDLIICILSVRSLSREDTMVWVKMRGVV